VKQTAKKYSTIAVTAKCDDLLRELKELTFIPKSKLVEIALERYLSEVKKK